MASIAGIELPFWIIFHNQGVVVDPQTKKPRFPAGARRGVLGGEVEGEKAVYIFSSEQKAWDVARGYKVENQVVVCGISELADIHLVARENQSHCPIFVLDYGQPIFRVVRTESLLAIDKLD